MVGSLYSLGWFCIFLTLTESPTAVAQSNITDGSDVISKLPVLGTIEWNVGELPFVCRGPIGGINGMGMIACDGKVYILGGHVPRGDLVSDCNSTQVLLSSSTVSRYAWRYDPETKKWEQLPDMPQRREYAAIASAEDKIYVLGGGEYDIDGHYMPSSDCFVLENCKTRCRWNVLLSATSARTHASAGVINDQFIFAGGNKYDEQAGGYAHATIQNYVECINLKEIDNGWFKCSPIPGYGRGWAASFAYNDAFYMFGGATFLEDGRIVRLKEVIRYDPVKDAWNRLKDMPMAGSGWQADCFENRYILLAGGVLADEMDAPILWNDLVLAYDIRNDVWFKLDGTLPPGGVFNNVGFSVVGDRIFIAGAEGPITTGTKGDRFNYFLTGRIKLK